MRIGYREEMLTTRAGHLDLAVPKIRAGSFFPGLLERQRRIDQALYAVIMCAFGGQALYRLVLETQPRVPHFERRAPAPPSHQSAYQA